MKYIKLRTDSKDNTPPIGAKLETIESKQAYELTIEELNDAGYPQPRGPRAAVVTPAYSVLYKDYPHIHDFTWVWVYESEI